MVEAKAKDQGHNAQVFFKKKRSSLKKIAYFLWNFRCSPKKRSSRRKSQIFCEISDEDKKGHFEPFLTNQK